MGRHVFFSCVTAFLCCALEASANTAVVMTVKDKLLYTNEVPDCAVQRQEKRNCQRCAVMKWMVFTCSCLACAMDFSLIFVFGTLFVHMLDTFGESRASTATVQSLLMGTGQGFGVVSGLIVKKIGVDKTSTVGSVLLSSGFMLSYIATSIFVLDILIGLTAGVGISMMYISSIVVVRKTFSPAVVETALVGPLVFVGLGNMSHAQLMNHLALGYGVKGAFLIIGGILLNNAVFTLIYVFQERHLVQFHEKSSVIVDADKQMHNDTACVEKATSHAPYVTKCISHMTSIWHHIVELMSLQYTLIILATGTAIAVQNAFLVVSVDLLKYIKSPTVDGADFLTILNVFNTLGRLSPILFSRVGSDNGQLLLLILSCLSGCGGQLLLWFGSSEYTVFCAAGLIGLSIGGLVCGSSVAVTGLVSKELFGVAFGLIFTTCGVLSSLAGPLYGYIRDTSKSYSLVIVLTVALLAGSAVLFSLCLVNKLCRTRTAVIQPSLTYTVQ